VRLRRRAEGEERKISTHTQPGSHWDQHQPLPAAGHARQCY
jgi:hypothetical protein